MPNRYALPALLRIVCRASIVLSALALVACDSTAPPNDAGPGGADAGEPFDAGEGSDAGVGGGDARPWLFVVNNGDALTSYAAANTADGAVEPLHELEQGAVTTLFQPRTLAITASGRLLVGRQNGGIVGWDTLDEATGETPASRTIEDPLLSTVISLAYDAVADRLFVGTANAAQGVLVYDEVSSAAFDGSVAPTRTFAPPDRAPYDRAGSTQMTIDAMAFDAAGALYVVDTSGANVNRSRVLVFAGPGAADGETAPVRTFETAEWGSLADVAIDPSGDLFAVDDGDTVYVVRDAASADGTPTAETQVLGVDRPTLSAVIFGSDGVAYVADRQNADLYIFDALGASSGTPDRTIAGTPTALRGPRDMFLVE